MSSYYILIVEQSIKTFSIIGHGQDCKFEFLEKGQNSLFEELNKGDKIIGFISNDEKRFAYLFNVDKKENSELHLIKIFELLDGPLLDEVDGEVRNLVLTIEQSKSLIKISENQYNGIVALMTKAAVYGALDVNNLYKIKNIECVKHDYKLEELGEILRDMYDNAAPKLQVAAIYIFGIKYGKNIQEKGYKVSEIIKAARMDDTSYGTELNKALNIYRCLAANTYGISILDENDYRIKAESGVRRKTGAENILLYGVPGAGKSHEIKTKYCADERYIERVVFHPDYMYSDFVGQILPRVDKDKDGNDKLRYVFTPGPFTKMLKKAVNDPENYYYLIIEELNRGNAPAIFGEIFQLLDRKDEDEFPAEEVGESEYGISNYDVAREVYQDEEHPVRIPSNMFILATMNTADQNVFTLDTAFQRRWNMKQIENRVQSAEHANAIIAGTKVNWGAFATVINDMVIEINVDMASSEDKRLGAYFVKKKELEASRFPEKVLKYLWDDAFKMDKTAIFNDSCKTLEDVVITYETTTSDKLAAVLRLSVYEKMLSKMQKSTVEDNEN